MKAIVRPVTSEDVEANYHHTKRARLESGRDGDFIFAPYDDRETWDVPFEKYAEGYGKRLTIPVTETGWERGWVIADANGIYGECFLLNRPALKSHLHRCLLMMGIERSHRRQGFGTALLKSAIDWATAQPSLDWIDLFVFEENPPAKALYKKMGFKENGTVHDMFRVFGKKISDTSMSLKLRE